MRYHSASFHLQQSVHVDRSSADIAHTCARHEQLRQRLGKPFKPLLLCEKMVCARTHTLSLSVSRVWQVLSEDESSEISGTIGNEGGDVSNLDENQTISIL